MPTASILCPQPPPSKVLMGSSWQTIPCSPLLTPWTDPQSGATSFLLTTKAAPLQQSFYFVNPSITDDGRYYWFYCAFPPAGNANQGRSLGVADLVKHQVFHFPETGFTDASPLVDSRTGEAYWCTGLEIWKRRPEPDAKPEFVNSFPKELAHNRRPWRLATHLTFSADRTAVNLDVEIGGEWYVGRAPLDGGKFDLWQKFDRCYNHGQYHPVDPELQLIAQDAWVDQQTGKATGFTNRLWLIHRGRQAVPAYPDPVPQTPFLMENTHLETKQKISDARATCAHEWWGKDGRHIWYVHHGCGVERLELGKTTPELLWPHPTLSHAHANAQGNLLVADNLPPEYPASHKVLFRNQNSGKEVAIVSRLPQLSSALSRYHIHSHPQFCLEDRFICYTTTVRGEVDVAFAAVEELEALSS